MALSDEQILEYFLGLFGQPEDSLPVPAERYEQFAFLPPFVHKLWRQFGFCSFHKGLLWICDPLEWTVPTEAWTSRLQLTMGQDRWWCLYRTAFGDLNLWGERTGPSLQVDPHNGFVVPSDHAAEVAQDGGENAAGAFFLTEPEEFELARETDKPIFERLVKKLGPVGRDEMYSFVPSPRFGGPEPSVKTAVIEKAIPQLDILAQAGPIEVLGDIGAAWLDSGIEI